MTVWVFSTDNAKDPQLKAVTHIDGITLERIVAYGYSAGLADLRPPLERPPAVSSISLMSTGLRSGNRIFASRSAIILSRASKLHSKPSSRRNQMRRLFLVLVGTLIFCSPVLAATATGTVKSISTKDDAITLSDGKTYGLPEGIEAEDLKVGQKVQVTYSKANGKIKVLAVHVLK
jgi:hypothetical protein